MENRRLTKRLLDLPYYEKSMIATGFGFGDKIHMHFYDERMDFYVAGYCIMPVVPGDDGRFLYGCAIYCESRYEGVATATNLFGFESRFGELINFDEKWEPAPFSEVGNIAGAKRELFSQNQCLTDRQSTAKDLNLWVEPILVK